MVTTLQAFVGVKAAAPTSPDIGRCVVTTSFGTEKSSRWLQVEQIMQATGTGKASQATPGPWAPKPKQLTTPTGRQSKRNTMCSSKLLSCSACGRKVRIVAHSEYAMPNGRKVGISGFTMNQMRALAAALIPGFKKRVNQRAIKVGTPPVFNRVAWKFVDGQTAPKPVEVAPGNASSKPKPKPAPSLSGKVDGEWPKNPLAADGKFWLITKRGYQRLLAPKSVGDYRGTIDGEILARTVKAEQRWLKGLDYYKGLIDGVRGAMTIRTLQMFLRDKGFYKGLIDGKFLVLSIKGLQQYLNSQRKHYV